MQKVLRFEDTPEGRLRFRYVYDGAVVGSTGARSKDVLRKDATIQRALQAISDPTPHPLTENRHMRSRDLKPGAQQVVLDAGQIERLEQCLLLVPWGGGESIEAADALDLVTTAPEWKADPPSA